MVVYGYIHFCLASARIKNLVNGPVALVPVLIPLRNIRLRRKAGIKARIATFSDYLQTAQVMNPADLMPGSDISFARKIAVR
jgi:hypothetical protein